MKHQEVTSGLVFLAAGLLFFFFSWQLPGGNGNTLGPRYWPQLITVGLIILAILLTLRGVFSSVRQRLNFSWSDPRRKKILLIFVLTGIYVMVWTLLGFFIPTVLFLFFLMFILHPQKPMRLLFYSLTIASALYAGFYWGMRIPFH